MKVGIHLEPAGGSIGGAETSASLLAEALACTHDVEIVHHRPALTLARLAGLSGASLGAVRLRHATAEPYPSGASYDLRRRYRESAAWQAALSEPYDLFITYTQGIPPFCRAPVGVLMVLFPLAARPSADPRGSRRQGSLLVTHVKRRYQAWEWSRRMRGYQLRIANSRFTREWTRRRWAIECKVVYPPVHVAADVAPKADTILSVGRFATEGLSKRQVEMVAAFRELAEAGLSGWQYACVGGLGDAPGDRAYFERVRAAAAGGRAQVRANVERPELSRLYAGAKVFWHAAGLAESDAHPERAEHFGRATVEAMAAGCVPIVVNRGGQPEIVRHGIDGFLWTTVEELKGYTLRVARDEGLRARMADAARARAAAFGHDVFADRFLGLLSRLPAWPRPAAP